MKNQVLVLNISNRKINFLFNKLRESYPNSIPKLPHVTIRGPQKDFKQSTINNTKDIIQKISMEIIGLDIIESNNISFCVFKINAPSLKKVWNKPDFPKKEFGYNPHITLYKGDKHTAEFIKNSIEKGNRFNNLIITSKDIEIKKSIIGQHELSI